MEWNEILWEFVLKVVMKSSQDSWPERAEPEYNFSYGASTYSTHIFETICEHTVWKKHSLGKDDCYDFIKKY